MPRSRRQQFLDTFNQGTRLGAAGATGDEQDPLRQLLLMEKLKAIPERQAAKQAQTERLEARTVASEFKNVIGDTRDKLTAIQNLKSLIKDPSNVTIGQLKTGLARLKEKGVLTDKDINRALPGTLQEDVGKLKAYFGMETDNALPPEILQKAKQLIDATESDYRKKLKTSQEELKQSGRFLAPTLTKTGKLEDLAESLGYSAGAASPEPAVSPTSSANTQQQPEQKRGFMDYVTDPLVKLLGGEPEPTPEQQAAPIAPAQETVPSQPITPAPTSQPKEMNMEVDVKRKRLEELRKKYGR